jgi:hypothetical protein
VIGFGEQKLPVPIHGHSRIDLPFFNGTTSRERIWGVDAASTLTGPGYGSS